jgi:hypothetical protein
MNTINIPHIDGRIWNSSKIIVDIIDALKTHGSVNISMDGEGSDLDCLGLIAILDSLCNQLEFLPDQISIVTHNQLEPARPYQISKLPPLYIKSGQQFLNQYQSTPRTFNNIKHFGSFISRSSWQRLWIASWLDSYHGDNTLMTYHYDSNHDYHQPHLGLDQLTIELGPHEAMKLCCNFIPKLPIKQDSVDSYPILTPAHFNISKIYHNFFLEIVCETFLLGTTFYPTEKIWRPLINMTPFMVVGPKHYLANLKKLGFKTFSTWWDEVYDEDADLDNGKESIRCIQRNCDQIGKLSMPQLKSLYNDMLPVLQHNQQRFRELTIQEFNKIWP